MYKIPDRSQPSFLDFNQLLGFRMDPGNRWVQLAARVPWDILEEKYAALFPSGTGNVAKPLRLALGSLIIQNRFQYSDRELVEQLAENPYLQYFIGLPGYQTEAPFDASTQVERFSAGANAALAWGLLLRSSKQHSLHRLRYPYLCRICSGCNGG